MRTLPGSGPRSRFPIPSQGAIDATLPYWIMEGLGFRQAVAWSDGLEFWERHYRHRTAAYRSTRSRGYADPDGYPGSIRWDSGPGDRLSCRCLGGSGTPPTALDCYRPGSRFHPGHHSAGGSAWGAAHRATLRGGSAV